MAETVFATVEEYEARYGAPGDEKRLKVLLGDASNYMLSAFEEVYGTYAKGVCDAFDRNAGAVCCLLVSRVLNAPAAMAGATQYSQGAGGYTASVTFGSAMGEMYLGKTVREALGLDAQIMRSLHPMERGEL
ncbi:Gp19/Gp15/Gp42 family protein [Collinsella sp. An2]|uniref:Gp19/Gp15/Gp42 family protein n=1 Tax=Collinsella sp. An2 TaxID=1965585 RepID=UPI000B3761D2|nr:Gp19/Gp15/Gp42 family protein [Collinsella sp. An2]OUP10995.1 hypothetical protein B5F33_01010 [Collinsella sp. An2]